MSEAVLTRRDKRGKDYGYGNARVRGMKSRLLKESYLGELIDTQDIGRIIQMLSQSEYGPDLEAALIHGRTAIQVDEALKTNMVRTLKKVSGFINDEASVLTGVLLGRWDLFDMKTMVRGKHMHLPAEDIERSLIGVGQFTAVELKALSRVEDVRAFADTLATWGSPYAVPLRESMADYLKSGDLSGMELALDRYYYEQAAERLKGRGHNYATARRVLGLQVDAINLLTLFRLMKSDIGEMEPSGFFLGGGIQISQELFVEVSALSDIDEVLDRLKRTPYGPQLESVVVNYVETNSISVFERALEDYVMRKALAAGAGDPLGFGVLVTYLWAKQNEITNLRIIVKGTSVGMPPDRIRKELIVV